jgi:hypothetical protein
MFINTYMRDDLRRDVFFEYLGIPWVVKVDVRGCFKGVF